MNLPNNLPPLPLMNYQLPPLNYCPITTGVVNSVVARTQAPTDLIVISALSTYSIILQGLIDVERPEVGRGPVSLFALTIAESGERKSTVSAILEKPITDFQEAQNTEYESTLAEYEVDKEVFEAEVNNLRKAISKKMKTGHSIVDLKKRLVDLKSSSPKKPRKTQLLFEDVTPESIAFELSKGCGSAALVSHEGATILSGRAVQDLSRINKLWSAERFTVNRKSAPSFTVDDARLTFSIMAQPAAISKFMKKKGEESLGIGFWARFIICNPCSTQGARFIGNNLRSEEELHHKYVEKASEILNKVKENNENLEFEREVVQFSSEAKRYWIDLSNRIESHLNAGGRFQHAKDHGSKLAENVARIAALLSYIENGDGQQITLGILMDAEKIAFYFSDHFLRCFEALPEYAQDILVLDEHFQSLREGGDRYVRKNKILQSGPSRLRNKAVLDQSLLNVSRDGYVELLTCGRGMVVVDLYPGYAFDKFEWNSFCFKNRCNQYSVV